MTRRTHTSGHSARIDPFKIHAWLGGTAVALALWGLIIWLIAA